ncbi:hypothetical protein [Undibacterium sp. TJN19]|uniref:hypothetical protein n=1 Tax=Undibacterium sp. TJN19 TaxID=3413055 RepID=UPI003BF2A979
MAESIIIHFRTADHDSVATLISQLAAPAGAAASWHYPDHVAYTLTLYPYHDLLDEYEPDSIRQLKNLLNGLHNGLLDGLHNALPSSSWIIELRRSVGDRSVADAAAIAMHLIGVLDGVIDDTCGEMWTAAEISAGVIKSEGAFLDCYRTGVGSL